MSLLSPIHAAGLLVLFSGVLALASGPACDAGAGCEAAVSLLQHEAVLSVAAAHEEKASASSLNLSLSEVQATRGSRRRRDTGTAGEGTCDCLGWQDAYANYGANCSLDFVGFGAETCVGFFPHIPEAVCVNKGISSSPTQVCLTSSACDELNGGASVVLPGPSANLRTKVCTPGKDAMLSQLTVEELKDFADTNDLDIGLTTKLAYATAAKSWMTLSNGTLEKFQLILESNVTTIVDSADGHPPFGVVQGTKIYMVTMNYSYTIPMLISNRSSFQHPSKNDQIQCVSGC